MSGRGDAAGPGGARERPRERTLRVVSFVLAYGGLLLCWLNQGPLGFSCAMLGILVFAWHVVADNRLMRRAECVASSAPEAHGGAPAKPHGSHPECIYVWDDKAEWFSCGCGMKAPTTDAWLNLAKFNVHVNKLKGAHHEQASAKWPDKSSGGSTVGEMLDAAMSAKVYAWPTPLASGAGKTPFKVEVGPLKGHYQGKGHKSDESAIKATIQPSQPNPEDPVKATSEPWSAVSNGFVNEVNDLSDVKASQPSDAMKAYLGLSGSYMLGMDLAGGPKSLPALNKAFEDIENLKLDKEKEPSKAPEESKKAITKFLEPGYIYETAGKVTTGVGEAKLAPDMAYGMPFNSNTVTIGYNTGVSGTEASHTGYSGYNDQAPPHVCVSSKAAFKNVFPFCVYCGKTIPKNYLPNLIASGIATFLCKHVQEDGGPAYSAEPCLPQDKHTYKCSLCGMKYPKGWLPPGEKDPDDDSRWDDI
jgi:hypothetical protein